MAAGGAYESSVNLYEVGAGLTFCTLQVDEWAHVVGQTDFSVRRYSLSEWVDGADEAQAQVIEADDAVMALELHAGGLPGLTVRLVR